MTDRPRLHAFDKRGLVIAEQASVDAAQVSGTWIRSDYWVTVQQ